MGSMVSLALWAVIIGAVIYNVFVKKGRDRKAAESGEDRENVLRAVGQMLEGNDKGASMP